MDYIEDLIKFLALIIYSFTLWIFFRYWDNEIAPERKNERLKTERLIDENEQLITENGQLKIKGGQLMSEITQLKAENGQKKNQNAQLMTENAQMKAESAQLKVSLEQWKKFGRKENETVKMLKSQNSILFETLNRTNKERELELEKELERETVPAGKPENGSVFDCGVSTNEIDAMIQVMNGRRVVPKVQNQVVQTIQKTHGTELYNQLIDRINGAKQRVEEALNGDVQTYSERDDDDWISKFLQVRKRSN